MVLLLALSSSGCGTISGGRAWGQNATLFPGGETLKDAFVDAATDPWTWVPAAGALLFAVEDLDEQLSDWAVDHTPIFGSTDGALGASDVTRSTLIALSVASSLSTDSGNTAQVWLPSKAKGFAVGSLAFLATDRLVSDLKSLTDRTRPNGNSRSMPSTHSAQAFAAAAWTSRNLDSLSVPEAARRSMRVVLSSLAIATAWARVEGDVHYPSDVLVGASIGNFLTSFAHDAFLGLPGDPQLTASINPDGSFMVGLNWQF